VPKPQALEGKSAKPSLLEQSVVTPVSATIADAEDIEAIIAPIRIEIKASFEQPLVNAPKGLFKGRASEENLLGYWISDALRARSSELLGGPVEFAITNRGGIRANLRGGMLKVGDIFEVMPFDNELVVMDLTGDEVLQVITEGLLRRGGEPCSGVKVLMAGTLEKPVITATWEDGRPIDPKALVRVATTDYLFNGGDALPTLRKGRRPFLTGLPVRQVLLDACTHLAQQKRDLVAPKGGRYTFTPEIAAALNQKRLGF
jgi:2',3'-cyclic-nucleotide 2'-phosphodiesterase (5'-nucleotidase family)